MGKKSKKEKGKPRRKARRGWVTYGVVALLVAGLAGWGYQGMQPDTREPHPVAGGSTAPIMNPAQFSGQAYTGYLAASLYDKEMDQVYCHCNCDRPPFFHRSLRECFTTTHGAG